MGLVKELSYLSLAQLEQGIILIDQQHKILFCNTWFERHCSLDTREIIGQSFQYVFPDQYDGRIGTGLQKWLDFKIPSHISFKLLDVPFPLYHLAFDRLTHRELPQTIFIRNIETDAGQPYAALFVHDATPNLVQERLAKDKNQELITQNQYQKALFDSARDGMVTFTEDGRVHETNSSFLKLFNFHSDAPPSSLGSLIPELIEVFRSGRSCYAQLFDENFIEMVGITSEGKVINLDVSIAELIAGEELLFFASLRDNTERKIAQKQLLEMARYDQLTNLANRSYFQDELRVQIKKCHRQGLQFALMFLDLDRFKAINDTLGHNVGDELLKVVAARLKGAVRETDLVSRLGGDEFTLIIENIDTPNTAKIVAQKILDALKDTATVGNNRINIGSSIGIAVFPQDGKDVQTLIRHADMATCEAKSMGKGTFCFFNHAMNEKVVKQATIETELRAAIKNEHLIPFYQPQIDLKTGHIIGVESLIRWFDPEKGLRMPGEFIQVAEECDLISKLGKISFLSGLRDATTLAEYGMADIKISINLSPRQFIDTNLIPFLKHHIKESGIDPALICLEITEGHLIDTRGGGDPVLLLKELKRVGVLIAIDDFGMGYSSFSYLKDLPTDIVKIDRSFVDGSEKNKNAKNLLSGIIDIVHGLGMSVVAEGVENEEQAELLRLEGCEVGQGYHFAKPMSLEDLKNWKASTEG